MTARDELLANLVDQIDRTNPVDDHGHDFKMNKAFLDAKVFVEGICDHRAQPLDEDRIAAIIHDNVYCDKGGGVAGVTAAAEEIFSSLTTPSQGDAGAREALPRFVGGFSVNGEPRAAKLIFAEALTTEHHGEIARRMHPTPSDAGALREALERYGEHEEDCIIEPWDGKGPRSCSCGLCAALASPAPATGDKP